MALIDLINEVFRRVDQPRLVAVSEFSQNDDVIRVIDSLNQTLQRLFSSIPEEALPRIITVINTAVGQNTYDVPDGINPMKITQVQDMATRSALKAVDSLTVLFNEDLSISAKPTKYYEYEGRLGVYPTPDGIYVMGVVGAKGYTALRLPTDGNDLPPEWQRVLVLYATAVEKGELGMPDAQKTFDTYTNEMSRLLSQASLQAYPLKTPRNGLDYHA